MILIPPNEDGLKNGIDDFLVANGPDGLRKLMSEAKPSLFWEIEDTTALPEYGRTQPLRKLFQKLAILDPAEIPPWRKLCGERLGISTRDFGAQLKIARAQKDSKEATGAEEAARAEIEEAKQEAEREAARLSPGAIKLLRDPALLYRVGEAIHQLGVAGEDENIRLLYLAMTSRIVDHPISITLKGESSSGKSHTVEKVCQLFPPSAYVHMSGMSRQALVYREESYGHRTVIVFEHPGGEAADYNIRTLQSEGQIIFETVIKDPKTGQLRTERIEKEGPTNFIFTTTAPELQPENETRHWSLLTDDSPRLTSAAKLESAKRYQNQRRSSEKDCAVWRQVQNELKPFCVYIPYAPWLAEHTPDRPVRMRRDFNKLLALIEVVALLHQHQRETVEGMLMAGLADYFMAHELIGQVFQASLIGINKKVEALASEVQRICEKKRQSGEQDPTVKPKEIATALDTSSSSVSRWLRPAAEAGLIEVVSETAKGRITSVRPGVAIRKINVALPSVEALAEAFPELAKHFCAVHPITGEEFSVEELTQGQEKNCGIMS
jgi:DNA-binding transcriptional ArsR family regulator